MPALSEYQAMLNIITDNTSSAIAHVGRDGIISLARITRRSPQIMRYYEGKNFFRLLQMLFRASAKPICDAYLSCVNSRATAQVTRFKYETVRKNTEYYDWKFTPADGGVIVYVRNVAEMVYLEQEISAVLEQNESSSRQLLVAMSNIDFQLMDLDQTYKKLSALYRITSIVQHTVNEHEVMEEIVVGITTEFGFLTAAILLLDEERKELVAKASRGYSKEIRLPYCKGIAWRAMLKRDMVHVPDISQEPEYIPSGNDLCVTEVAIPLFVTDKAIGVLDIESSEERPIQQHDLNMLQSLAAQVALTIVHAQHVAKIEKQAVTDALTGLYNYRYFCDILEHEFKRAARYSRPLALLILDIDHFKTYNDTFGHLNGNEVLRLLAGIMRSVCREVDSCARYGGEEFVALLPETSASEAYTVAERIRQAVAEYSFPGSRVKSDKAITVSIGVAAYPDHANADRQLVERADAALYNAKHSKRNCVVVYSETNFE